MQQKEISFSNRELCDMISRAVSKNGNDNLLKLILLYIKEHNIKFYHYEEREKWLRCACANGRLDTIQLLIEIGAKVDQIAFENALEYKHFDVVRFLLEHGYDYYDPKSLMFKILDAGGELDLVKIYFEKKGADIWDCVKLMDTAYRLARGDIANFCIKQGGISLDYALCVAAGYGREGVVGALIERGANPNCNHGEPLMRAIEGKSLSTVRELIKRGASIWCQEGAAFHLASKNGIDHCDILEKLLNEAGIHIWDDADSINRWNTMISKADGVLKRHGFKEHDLSYYRKKYPVSPWTSDWDKRVMKHAEIDAIVPDSSHFSSDHSFYHNSNIDPPF